MEFCSKIFTLYTTNQLVYTSIYFYFKEQIREVIIHTYTHIYSCIKKMEKEHVYVHAYVEKKKKSAIKNTRIWSEWK